MKKILFIIFMSIFAENVHGFDFNNTDIHGFISQGFMISNRNNYYADTEDGTFEFNEMGINFSNQINDRLRVGMQFFSRDLGDMDNNEVGVDWALADYRWQDWLGLRVGRIKSQYGLYNYTRDIEMLRTSIFLPQSVYYEGGRETMKSVDGIGIYGHVPFTSSDSIDYKINYGSYTMDPECGFVKLLENLMIIDIQNVDSGELFLVNLEYNTFLKGLRLGGTLVMLDIKADALSLPHPLLMAYGIPSGVSISYEMNDLRCRSLSAEYSYENLILAAEYFSITGDIRIADIVPQEVNFEGYYGSLSYRFTDWFEAGAYYSVGYPDRTDKEGERFKIVGAPGSLGWQKEFVLSTRFDINENWMIKAEGHFINGAGMLFLQDNSDGLDEDSFMFAIKTTFSF